MTDLEAIMAESVSYALDFKKTVLFCRFCGRVSANPEDVKNRYCGNCHLFHDNIALENFLKENAT